MTRGQLPCGMRREDGTGAHRPRLLFWRFAFLREQYTRFYFKKLPRKTQNGENIKRIRISRGYTQQSFAEELGISPNHVYRIENAETRVSFPLFLKIKELLYVDGNTLLEKHRDACKTDRHSIEEIIRLLGKCGKKERTVIIRMIHHLHDSLSHVGQLK